MNFLIPLGGAASGVLQGLTLTRELQGKERELQEKELLRKQQEFNEALNAFTRVITSSNLTPEALKYTVDLLGQVFQKQGVTLPPPPPMKPKAVQDFEDMLKVIKMANEKYKAGEITKEERDAIVLGKQAKRERVVTVPYGDQMLELTVPEELLFKEIEANLRHQEKMATRGGGRGGGKIKSVSGYAAERLRAVKDAVDQGDIEKARILLEEYNALAAKQNMTQFNLVQRKVGGGDKFFLFPKDSKGVGPPSTKRIRPDEQARKQGLNLVPVKQPSLK